MRESWMDDADLLFPLPYPTRHTICPSYPSSFQCKLFHTAWLETVIDVYMTVTVSMVLTAEHEIVPYTTIVFPESMIS